MTVQHSKFSNKIHMVLCLLGLIPYLLTGYIFINAGMTLTQSVSLMGAMVLVFHFAGYHILRKFSDDLLDLVRTSAFTQQKTRNYKALPIYDHNTAEVVEIRSNINSLLTEIEDGRKKFDTVTVELLRESRKGFMEYERRLAELSPYVDPEVINKIMEGKTPNSGGGLHGEHRRVAVLFVDICGFTKTSEKLTPEAIVLMLNEFFDIVVQIIYQHNGIVDKFIGDAVMATFGLTTPVYQVSVDAVSTAVDLQVAADHLMRKWQKEGKRLFKIRVGVNTGEVVAGNIGSRDRMDYTVIGDAVNVASRLVDHANPGETLISAATYNSCKGYFQTVPRGTIKVKNRSKLIDCFVVTAKKHFAFQNHNKNHDSFGKSGKMHQLSSSQQ